jgi:peroxiredoxin
MSARTQTLEVNSHAPDFTLSAANRPQRFSLSELLSVGALVLEFLRGTW